MFPLRLTEEFLDLRKYVSLVLANGYHQLFRSSGEFHGRPDWQFTRQVDI